MTYRSLIVLALLMSSTVDARERSVVREFRKVHPCPATGQTTGACPGWVVDHLIPLCAGGPDHPANMQWQEKAPSLEKDKLEWAICRRLRACEK